MKNYEQSDLHDGLSICSQTENYIMLLHDAGRVFLIDLEFLLSIGLECCGVTAGGNFKALICCRKTV